MEKNKLEIKRVKIVTSIDNSWYDTKIGEEFEVEYDIYSIYQFKVIKGSYSGYFIEKRDCKVLPMNTNPTYSTITVTGGIAVATNPFDKIDCHLCEQNSDKIFVPCTCTKFEKFEQWKQSHTYATNAKDGVWPKERFGEPVWQYKFTNQSDWREVSDFDYNSFESYKEWSVAVIAEHHDLGSDYTVVIGLETRQFLPFIEQPETPLAKEDTFQYQNEIFKKVISDYSLLKKDKGIFHAQLFSAMNEYAKKLYNK